MPKPKKYEIKTEEPYGWLSPELREALNIDRILENDRKKEEAKQNKKKAKFEARQKKRHEINQNVRKADRRFAENLTDLADEYIGGTIDEAQTDIGGILEPWFDNPVMQSPYAQSLLSALTPTKWGRTVQDAAGAGVDFVSGKPRRPIHAPWDYTAPDMALTGNEDLDSRINFLTNIYAGAKGAKAAPKLATSLGRGVTEVPHVVERGKASFKPRQPFMSEIDFHNNFEPDMNVPARGNLLTYRYKGSPYLEYDVGYGNLYPSGAMVQYNPFIKSPLNIELHLQPDIVDVIPDMDPPVMVIPELLYHDAKGLLKRTTLQREAAATIRAFPKGTVFSSNSLARTAAQLPLKDKLHYTFTGRVNNPVEGNYSLDVARILNRHYTSPATLFSTEISPNTVLTGTNLLGNVPFKYSKYFKIDPGKPYLDFKDMTLEQVKAWNREQGSTYFTIDPETRTAPFYINIKNRDD